MERFATYHGAIETCLWEQAFTTLENKDFDVTLAARVRVRIRIRVRISLGAQLETYLLARVRTQASSSYSCCWMDDSAAPGSFISFRALIRFRVGRSTSSVTFTCVLMFVLGLVFLFVLGLIFVFVLVPRRI